MNHHNCAKDRLDAKTMNQKSLPLTAKLAIKQTIV